MLLTRTETQRRFTQGCRRKCFSRCQPRLCPRKQNRKKADPERSATQRMPGQQSCSASISPAPLPPTRTWKRSSSVQLPTDVALKPCTNCRCCYPKANTKFKQGQTPPPKRREGGKKKAILVSSFAKGSCAMWRWISNFVLGMWPGLPGRLQTLTVGTHWEHPGQQGFRHEQSRIVLAVRRGFGLEFLMATELECCWDGPDSGPRLLSLR